jgi:TolA-binding protein
VVNVLPRRHALVVFAAALTLAACPGVGHAAVRWLQAADDRQPWEFALDLAKRNRQPIMAFVYTANSPVTEIMQDQTFTSKQVSGLAPKFQCVLVDAGRPENRPFLARFGLGSVEARAEGAMVEGHSFPVTVFISPDGVAEHMVYGGVIAEDLATVMTAVLGVMAEREALAKQPEDAGALARLGGRYVELQRYEAAREVLEQALKLDPEAKKGTEAARLDLAIALLAPQQRDCDRAIGLITEYIGLYPEGELSCKAHYLLGGALLGAAEAHQDKADELAAQDKQTEAAQERQQAQLGRRQAEEAWRWFEATKERKAPCEGTEWSTASLGALDELRTEIGYHGAEEVALSGAPKEAVKALRQFIADTEKAKAERDKHLPAGVKPSPESLRVQEAWYLIGKELMEDKDYAQAAEHWRKFLDRYPVEPRPSATAKADPESSCDAAFLLGECLYRTGKRNDAMAIWKELSDTSAGRNPCAYTPAFGKSTGAVEDPETALKELYERKPPPAP